MNPYTLNYSALRRLARRPPPAGRVSDLVIGIAVGATLALVVDVLVHLAVMP